MDFLTRAVEFGPIRLVAWEIAYVIVLVLVLAVVLNTFLFKPMLAVLAERDRKLQEARDAQESALRTLEERTRGYSEAITAARREAVTRMEAARREAETAHRDKLGESRKTAEGRVTIAKDVIAKATRRAEQELRTSAQEMGRRIAARILGREVSA